MSENDEEIQTVIFKAWCPTKGCTCVTFLEMPTQIDDMIECKVCGKTTPAKDWID
jgi:hypothetical protein